ncbi:U6 snRNA-associated Sm-like protein LSm8 [Marchantia polymorpha subsp. ruderalis]|uniref:U6 snRNA-associated Sm-like protein LSm8 n=2 Tax=Marchantia polymorpha TaxID=3197 RepID=A0AAF6BXN3_MARPO|nr:hypothetical protein MARPO_0068s0064 [Marchantia polymorpha]BBN16767.1 hypothetical protein Mp_7g09110 [Marchantia polymorpha subsp. ruderalis]|eukprot:PTQ35850.1 hypothetical protein MARPO_0068s0064 [Marchantia polymorpha]
MSTQSLDGVVEESSSPIVSPISALVAVILPHSHKVAAARKTRAKSIPESISSIAENNGDLITELAIRVTALDGVSVSTTRDVDVSVLPLSSLDGTGGFGQATNLILDESHERVYSTKARVEQLVLGLYIIRGDNIEVVGELDEELDSNLDLSSLRAHPLKPVEH